MVQTTLKHSEFRSMPTAAFAVFTSQTDSIQKRNYPQNSNSTCLLRRNKFIYRLFHTITDIYNANSRPSSMDNGIIWTVLTVFIVISQTKTFSNSAVVKKGKNFLCQWSYLVVYNKSAEMICIMQPSSWI